jgi:putative transposase
MARKLRIYFPGAIYHVILRGNNRQKIFFNVKHYQQFCIFLKEGIDKFGHRIHAFCLMPNHIHLIIEVNQYSLAQIMQNIAYRYSRWLNHQLKRIGHLFQGRYKAILIQNESYMLELCRYIHLNPVKAKLVDFPENYQWSSHRAYLGLEHVPWLTIDFILELLPNRLADSNISYNTFMQQNNDHEFIPYFATDSTGKLIVNDSIINNTNRVLKIKKPKPNLQLNFIVDTICTELDVNATELSLPDKRRELAEARTIITFFAQEYTNIKVTELARIFQRSPQRISNAVNELRRLIINNSSAAPEISRINNKLQVEHNNR